MDGRAVIGWSAGRAVGQSIERTSQKHLLLDQVTELSYKKKRPDRFLPFFPEVPWSPIWKKTVKKRQKTIKNTNGKKIQN